MSYVDVRHTFAIIRALITNRTGNIMSKKIKEIAIDIATISAIFAIVASLLLARILYFI